jgi:sialate O-acetylesterase
MVVTTDCGDANDIHPTRKQPVGARLALAARALAYGEKLEYAGPVFESIKIKGAGAELRFTHVGGRLVAKGGPLKGFTMAGPDGVFHAAQAVIRGKTVVVSSDAVSQPAAVRYGWANVPEGNLFNKAGLPATPFRTDGN